MRRMWDVFSMPLIALTLALTIGALIILITSGSFRTVVEAYGGLFEGAFTKQRGFSESLVATIPYVFASLAIIVGFKAGLFNIGVEGQFTIGAVCAAWAGIAFSGLPAVIHLPLALLAGALGGALWAAIPAILKAKTGAHEVINGIMMNYIAFRVVEYLVSGPLRDQRASAVQTSTISPAAELWTLAQVPARVSSSYLNALFLSALISLLIYVLLRWLVGQFKWPLQQRGVAIISLVVCLVISVLLYGSASVWWPFTDERDRLHIGVLLAPLTAFGIWWLLTKTTIGFELRTIGANPDAAKYAGVNLTRNILLAMSLSGALAGVSGTIEVLGVSICRCLPIFFSAGYGFDSIAIALLARTDALGILPASLLFGVLRNGADTMEFRSGVSKYIISLIQALALLFIAAPAIVRWLTRQKAEATTSQTPLTRGWGS